MGSGFTIAIQENILVILCYDEVHFRWARHAVDPALFDNVIYRTISQKAITFIDSFNAPPKDHIYDELEAELRDPKQGDLYRQTLQAIWTCHSEQRINFQYVVSSVNAFRTRQILVKAIRDAANLVNTNEFDEAKSLLLGSVKTVSTDFFDPGVTLGNLDRGLITDATHSEFSSGVPIFNRRGVVPARGELYVFMGRTGTGKSWWAVHLGALGLKHRHKVVHITLELSLKECYTRYIQNLFAVRKDAAGSLATTYVRTDSMGIAVGLDLKTLDLTDRPVILSDQGRAYVASKLAKLKGATENLRIRQWPTGNCDMSEVRSYLDTLEQAYKFIPDLLIIDYVDLLKITNINFYRFELDRLYKELRGIAVERNMAVVTFSQSNRKAEDALVLTAAHPGEAYSKVQNCDILVTSSATENERARGTARLWVAKGRAVEDKFSVIISYNHAIGQVVLSSGLQPRDYKPMIGLN